MILLFPQALWGLLLLLLPLLIHLFQWRRFKRVVFSDVRLLRNVQQETRKVRRLKHLIVLLLRMLLLAALVLAFAQPFVPAQESSAPNQEVYIVLDNSQSMSRPSAEGDAALNFAKRQVEALLTTLPKDQRVFLLTAEGKALPPNGYPKQEVLNQLARLDFVAGSFDVEQLSQRLRSQVPAGGSVYWFSDFQGFEAVSDALDSTYRHVLVPVGTTAAANGYVDSLWMERRHQGQRQELTVRVANGGEQGIIDMPINVSVEGTQLAQTAVSVPSRGRAELSFDLPPGTTGAGVVELQDPQVYFDNSYYFVLAQRPAVKVVALQASDEPSFTTALFADSTLFEYQEFTLGNLSYSAVNEADIIVWNGLGVGPESLQATVADALGGGATVVFIPDGRQEAWPLFVKGRNPQLLPAVDSARLELTQHPLFSQVFEGDFDRGDMPKVRITHRLAAGWGKAVLRTPLGYSFVAEGQGLYQFAAPLEGSGLAKHALVVPLFYQIAFAATADPSVPYHTETNPSLRVAAEAPITQDLQLSSGADVFIPRIGAFQNHQQQLVLPVERMDMGHYTLTHRDKFLRQVAVNLESEESVLSGPNQAYWEELAASSGHVDVLDGADLSSLQAKLQQRNQGTRYWQLCIVLALIFALGEAMVLRFW